MINYKQIVLNAYIDNKEQKTSFKSYFKREAKLAEKDSFIENNDFFNGCLNVISKYKTQIRYLYQSRVTENDWVVESIKMGRGMIIDGEEITDIKNERLQYHLKKIEDDKNYIIKRGYKNNTDFPCFLSATGEITDEISSAQVELYWDEIILIKENILQAQNELSNDIKEYTNKKHKEIIPFKDYFLIQDEEKILNIINIIKTNLITAKSSILSIALFTAILQEKNYITKDLNKSQYHKSAAQEFGKKVGLRNKFNEYLNEITTGHYDNELKNIRNLIP